ncbi:glutamate-1-semialdehyde 2,1-aminomutase [Bacteriovoracaceae bacterium]|nr:glutamate-1-semialdehyde 2,1-aminomutase [Bacteriovoracaceae bacterium]
MDSKQLFDQAKKYIPGGVHSPVRSFKNLKQTPLFIKSAKGPYLYTEEGKEYIDFCQSFGPLILGHQDELVFDKIKQALSRGWSYGACEKYSLDLAEFIINKIPFIDKIRFVSSGTEAVMTALRLARGFTKKDKVLKFIGCYHGHVDSMLIQSGSGLAGEGESSSAGVPANVIKDTLLCPLDNIEKFKEIIHTHKDEIAAVIMEPLPANYGLLLQNENYLKEIRKITKEQGILLIFDEVISGFRITFGGMAEYTGITPDIVTYGKVIGGGMPVGAIAAKSEIMDHLAPTGQVYQAGTLSANPIAMVAGIETLKQLTSDFYANLNRNTKDITNEFSKFFSQHDKLNAYQVIQVESLFWITPESEKPLTNIEDIPSNINELFDILFEEFLNRGIYLSPNAYEISFNSKAHGIDVIQQIKDKLCK